MIDNIQKLYLLNICVNIYLNSSYFNILMMNNYLYINRNSLDPELCDEIIHKFELEVENENTRPGVTYAGFNKDIKDTTDFNIEFAEDHYKWNKIHECLKNELTYNLKKYAETLDSNYKHNNYHVFPKEMFFKTFQIQKYIKNIGKFTYHNDASIEENCNYRVLTYIWYLNDVLQGGETEICKDEKIKPQIGKLLLFPASWMYPHCGKMPISNNKYIITGWIYSAS